jgi:hypothetical protein
LGNGDGCGLATAGCGGLTAGNCEGLGLEAGGCNIATLSPSAGNLAGSFAVLAALLWGGASRIVSGSSSRATVGASSCRTADTDG